MVDSDYWKQTAELFTPLIEKPKMVEKLLKKPPPKYVFDIIVNTMKATKFNQGLFSDTELDPKHFEADKQNRLDFFQKSIDIAKLINSSSIDINKKNICMLIL